MEICRAINLVCESVKKGNISIDSLNVDSIEQKLYTANLPQLDLLIRTSGEIRLSDFM